MSAYSYLWIKHRAPCVGLNCGRVGFCLFGAFFRVEDGFMKRIENLVRLVSVLDDSLSSLGVRAMD